jgi:hypothetical protein
LVDFTEDHLSDKLSEYQHYYNWDRIHGSIGKTPIERATELSQKTPFWNEVENDYDPTKEPIRAHAYRKDVKLLKLKRSL